MSEQHIQYEEKIAFLEKQVSDLDEMVRTLNEHLRTLERGMGKLRRQYEQHLASLHEPGIAGGEA